MVFIKSNLVKKAKAGEKKALELLYRENVDALFRFVLYKTGNRDNAKDIVSQAFLKAFENIQKFKEKSSFKSWLYSIANNLIIDSYKQNKNLSIDSEFEEKLAEEIINEDDSEIAMMKTSENDRKIKMILNSLSESYRKVLECRFLLNMNINETAEFMETTTGNVKVLQNRALKKAREILLNTDDKK